jgi:Cell division control protein 14, SIN component
MNLLLDLLEPSACPAVQSATLLTLVCTLLGSPSNTRVFEQLDGLLTVTSLFKMKSTSREVKLKLVEFLYFYLMPEAPLQGKGLSHSVSAAAAPGMAPGAIQRSKSFLGGLLGGGASAQSAQGARRPGPGHSRAGSYVGSGASGYSMASEGGGTVSAGNTRNIQDKQSMLGQYLSNVEDLVEDLRESAPFGQVC